MTERAHFEPFIVFLTVVCLALLAAPAVPATESAEPPRSVSIDTEISPPEIILKTQKPPVYPPAAKAARFDGEVTVRVQIKADGKVGDVEIIDCTHPNVGFESATAVAVKKWEFYPAMLNGEPVEFFSQFRLNFRSGPQTVTSSAHGASPRSSSSKRPPTVRPTANPQ